MNQIADVYTSHGVKRRNNEHSFHEKLTLLYSVSVQIPVYIMIIKAKLIEAKELKAAAIHVDASNGTVTLSGFVETESQRQLASSITQRTPNVKRVDNQIKVK